MNRPSIITALIALPLAALAATPEAPTAVPTKCLLLQSGQVLSGEITRVGDRYEVRRPGSELRIRADDVAACCSDFKECYGYLAKHREQDDMGSALELANWCLRHHLLDEAAAELAQARQLDGSHPRIELLAKRLQLALQDPPLRRAAPQSTGGASVEDLDRMVRGMTGDAVEQFTTTIQPLLVNHCSNAGCHGPNSESAFRLLRLPPSAAVDRRTTQRNLHAVVSFVDIKHPADSPILTVPMLPHGTSKAPIFTSRAAPQFQQLVAWTRRISHAKPADEAVASEKAAKPSPPPSATKTRRVAKRKSRPQRPGEPTGQSAVKPAPKTLDAVFGPPLGTPKRGAPPPDYANTDPYSPDVINRQLGLGGADAPADDAPDADE